MTHPFTRLRVRDILLACALLLVVPRAATAQSADNVLLVVNDTSAASATIAAHYQAQRHLADTHVVHIKAPDRETVSRTQYEQTIEGPVGAWLARNALQDRILYIVLTKGVPLRIAGTGGRDGSVSSVDSELTLLYRKLLGYDIPALGRVPNPYYLNAAPIASAKRFTRFTSDLYLVTRLDGFTVEDVLRLIDRGMSPSTAGRIVLDQKSTLVDRGGDGWLAEAAARIGQTADASRVLLEDTKAVAATTDPVIGYYSWGSNDPANVLRRFGLTFSPGAIGGMFVSSDGRTFVEPPADWKPSGPNGGPGFAGSFQSLAGDLIRDGITGVAGHVEEPLLDATIRPQVLFPAYLAGFTLAESFYLAMPFVSWQTVVVGDPLCAPFQRRPLTPAEIDKGMDAETELPAMFAERRLAMASSGGLNQAAVRIMLKLEGQMARGDRSQFEPLLVKAADMEPRLVAAQSQLADYYTAKQDYVKAADRFRRIIAADEGNVTALNNLAYFLSEYLNAPREGLSYALRAYKLKPDPLIADTLGWTYHRLGDDSTALAYIEPAASASGNAEILLHAATLHAARNPARARAELDRAEQVDAAIAARADFKALRAQLAPR
jgi:uncharacterized protein (TIGR03790 family)